MNHFNSKTWTPIVPANGTSVRYPSIVSDAGKVMTVAWQGNVADTNRLVQQLCAMPDLVAALQQVRNMLENHPDADRGNSTIHFAYMQARNALAKLEF